MYRDLKFKQLLEYKLISIVSENLSEGSVDHSDVIEENCSKSWRERLDVMEKEQSNKKVKYEFIDPSRVGQKVITDENRFQFQCRGTEKAGACGNLLSQNKAKTVLGTREHNLLANFISEDNRAGLNCAKEENLELLEQNIERNPQGISKKLLTEALYSNQEIESKFVEAKQAYLEIAKSPELIEALCGLKESFQSPTEYSYKLQYICNMLSDIQVAKGLRLLSLFSAYLNSSS